MRLEMISRVSRQWSSIETGKSKKVWYQMVPITVMMVFLDTYGTKRFKNGLLVYGFPLLVCAGVCWCVLVCAGVCWCVLVCAGVCWCLLVYHVNGN